MQINKSTISPLLSVQQEACCGTLYMRRPSRASGPVLHTFVHDAVAALAKLRQDLHIHVAHLQSSLCSKQ